MLKYFIRRLLLVIPTFIGITLLVFAVTRFVPGGPMERAIQDLMMANGKEGQGGRRNDPGLSGQPLSEKQLEQLKEIYGLDKAFFPAYIEWLGKIVRLDFGKSTRYNDPVLEMIVDRLDVSLTFGVTSTILVYLICIPLGIRKALKHKKSFDNVSSAMVFIGYALPGYIVGIVLLSLFSFNLGWLPLGGFKGAFYEHMSLWQKISDRFRHMLLPMIAYTIGNFAVLTMMMKNNLMENMAADYIKTAVAKGRTFKEAMWFHAFRNSIIPIAAGLGSIITIFLAGSFLIENIFNLRGMGMLGYKSIMARDYPVVLGVLAISSFVSLLANILSDFILSLVDPRIKLGR